MAYSLIRRRYSVLARIANSFESSFNVCHRSKMSTLNSAPLRKLSPPPWLLLPPAYKGGGDMVYRFYNLVEDRVESFSRTKSKSELTAGDELCEYKFVGSSHGWLAMFNPRNNHLFLSNPITGRLINLPSIETLSEPDLNLTRDGRGSVSKVILSCCPDTNADECRAMMTFGPCDWLAFCHPGRSTEWTPIGDRFFYTYKEEVWKHLVFYGVCYEDFVYCNRRKVFGCISQLEIDFWDEHCPQIPTKFEVWDLSSSSEPKSTSFCWHHITIRPFFGGECTWLTENKTMLTSSSCRQIPYLVFSEEYGQMFVVIRFVMERVNGHDNNPSCVVDVDIDNISYDPISGRLSTHLYPYKTIGFSVLKLEYGKRERTNEVDRLTLMVGGNNMDSLDRLALFVGTNHSFAVVAADEVGLKPNSIYFTDSNKNPTLPPDSIYGGHDIGIFDYENKTISPCYYPSDVHSLRKIVPAPMWFTPTPH